MQASLKLVLAATYPLLPAADLQTAGGDISYSKSLSFADGTGNNQADRLFSDTRTLLASANEDLDLAGTLTDVFGRVLTFVKLKAFAIVAAPTNTNKVQVRRGATNGVPIFTAVSAGVADLEPGGMFLWTSPLAGVTVTPATGDLVNIANSGAGSSVNYDVVIIGTSA